MRRSPATTASGRARLGGSAVALALALWAPASWAASRADYGDAPDGAQAGYVTAPRVAAHFPSRARSHGAHHADGSLRLGAKFDVERDSRQVDRDRGDDGFFARLRACRSSTLTFVVNDEGLPAALCSSGHTAFLNLQADWNRDGRWKGASRCGRPEWAVKNRRVGMATFAGEPVQAITVKVVAGAQVEDLWMRATLTLDQKMRSAGRGAFRYGETEDHFYAGGGPRPALKGKRKKGRKGVPHSLLVDCPGAFVDHGVKATVPLFFTDSITGTPEDPRPGTVTPEIVNGKELFPPLPGDVTVKAISYGYTVDSIKDERVNPFEPLVVWIRLSAAPGVQLEPGPWTLGRETRDGVDISCFAMILHSHHVAPGGGPPGGGPPGGGPPGGGSPGGGTTPPANKPPVAAFTFTPADPKAGSPVSFDAGGSSDPDGTVTSWSWKVGPPLYSPPGTVSVARGDTAHATIGFPAAGVYPVTLTVTDDAGEATSITKNVFVGAAGSKSGPWTTDSTDPLGCSGGIVATEDVYIPTYAEMPVLTTGTRTGGCAGATVTITRITRQSSNAPPEAGHPRLDEWGRVKDTMHIEFTVTGGTSAQGSVPFTVTW